jgi:hypothetical protein
VLEHAGCDNAEILDHCRQPGEHVRGAGSWTCSWAAPSRRVCQPADSQPGSPSRCQTGRSC